eukprot:g64966.t1
MLMDNVEAFYDENAVHRAPIDLVVKSLMAFASFYDTLINKCVRQGGHFWNRQMGNNINLEKFREQIDSNVWSQDLFMLELLPGHSQQDVLPNIPPFIKNCHQGSVKTRHADITESSKYHFAALQAQSSALLYAFPVQDRRMKTFADWTREGKKKPNSQLREPTT